MFVYVFLIVGLRLAGKRELAQLNPFDLVVLLMLSNTVQNAIIGDDSSITGRDHRGGDAAGASTTPSCDSSVAAGACSGGSRAARTC